MGNAVPSGVVKQKALIVISADKRHLHLQPGVSCKPVECVAVTWHLLCGNTRPVSLQVLIVFAAMSTCDPGNIRDTIKAAKEARCRVSVVGLAAEVYICRQIVEVRHHCGRVFETPFRAPRKKEGECEAPRCIQAVVDPWCCCLKLGLCNGHARVLIKSASSQRLQAPWERWESPGCRPQEGFMG